MKDNELIQKARENYLSDYKGTPEEHGLNFTMIHHRKGLFHKVKQVVFAPDRRTAQAFDEMQSACETVVTIAPIATLVGTLVIVALLILLGLGYEQEAFALVIFFCAVCLTFAMACVILGKKYSAVEKDYQGKITVYSFK